MFEVWFVLMLVDFFKEKHFFLMCFDMFMDVFCSLTCLLLCLLDSR